MNRLIAWFAENHVAANLLMLFFLVAGIVTLIHIRVEIFPDAVPDQIRITVCYPGASPSEVEEGVIKPIEEKITGLAGIETIKSTAKEGLGVITIDVIKGWNTDDLLQDVKSAVDRVTNLPEEAERPVVEKVIRRYPVVTIAVYGDVSEKILKKEAERLKDELTELPEVTEVHLYAVRPDEIHIEIPEEELKKYNLSLQQVAGIVRRSSFNLPAGRVILKNREYLIRAKGRLLKGKYYKNIVILAKPDGSKVTLGDIAIIKDAFRDDRDLAGYFIGHRAMIVQVFRVGDQNALRISKAVNEYLKKFEKTLPPGIYVKNYFDTSDILKSRLKLLLKNLAIGMVFVVIILGLFMNAKLSFWVTLGIPVSFSAAIWLLPKFDVSINMVSLFGFILVLGIVVDDAIVIGENVFRRRELGEPPLEASIKGTIEMALPVTFAVLTTVAAFYPLLFGSGALGKVIRHIPIVVIFVLLGSLTEAFFVLPSHLAITHFKAEKEKKLVPRLLDKFVQGPFTKAIRFCLKWRYITTAGFIFLFLLFIGLFAGGRIKFTFFPKVEGDDINCYITMPAGTPAEKTLEIAKRIERIGREVIAEVDAKRKGKPSLFQYSLIMLGVQMLTHGPHAGVLDIGSHLAQITIKLLPAEERGNISAVELAKKWRERVGAVPEAKSIIFQSELFSMGKAVEFNLSHENERKLIMAVREFEDRLRSIPGVYDVADDFVPGKEELRIKLKPSAKELGLTLEDVSREVRAGYYGAEALRFQRGKDEVRVLVRLPDRERRSLGKLYELWIKTPSAKLVPLKEVAELKKARGYIALHRIDLKRVITVTADVDEKVVSGSEVRKEIMSKILPELRAKYPGLFYSVGGEGKEHMKAFEDVKKAFMLAMFLIYALLAVPLKSFFQPFIIMSAIPFGIIGALLGHVILGKPVSMLSIFGIVGLAGVVVNDALILVDAINRFRREGVPLEEAIVKSAVRRFRPIILTTLTTFVGLVPMITEKSLQAQFLIPMAISLGFGVLFATLITLFLVPSGYYILEEVMQIFGKNKNSI
jgi:multidrug efflux pump subunit AcrB